jgi:hypothetical protein
MEHTQELRGPAFFELRRAVPASGAAEATPVQRAGAAAARSAAPTPQLRAGFPPAGRGISFTPGTGAGESVRGPSARDARGLFSAPGAQGAARHLAGASLAYRGPVILYIRRDGLRVPHAEAIEALLAPAGSEAHAIAADFFCTVEYANCQTASMTAAQVLALDAAGEALTSGGLSSEERLAALLAASVPLRSRDPRPQPAAAGRTALQPELGEAEEETQRMVPVQSQDVGGGGLRGGGLGVGGRATSRGLGVGAVDAGAAPGGPEDACGGPPERSHTYRASRLRRERHRECSCHVIRSTSARASACAAAGGC